MALLRRYRRLVAAGMVGLASFFFVKAVQPPKPSVVTVVAVTHDLPAGHVLAAGDLELRQWPRSFALTNPFTAVDRVIGRLIAGPMFAGEPLSVSRVVGPGLLDIGSLNSDAATAIKLVAATVRLADPGEANLLRPGDLVDVLAATSASAVGVDSPAAARVVARDARVITVPSATEPGGATGLLNSNQSSTGSTASSRNPSMVILAVTPSTAADLAGAGARSRLSVLIKSPGAS